MRSQNCRRDRTGASGLGRASRTSGDGGLSGSAVCGSGVAAPTADPPPDLGGHLLFLDFVPSTWVRAVPAARIGAGRGGITCRAGRAELGRLLALIGPTRTDGRRFWFPRPLALLPPPDLLGIEAQVTSSKVQH